MVILTSQNHGGRLSCWIGVTIGYNPYYYDMVEAKNYFRLDYTSTLYIYKEFNHIPMQWMVIWMHPYFIKAMEVDWADWIWVTTGYKKYHNNYDIAEAKKHFRLDQTSILFIYKVFKHLPMQWMVIWMRPYFIKAMEVDSADWIWLTIGYTHTTTPWHGWGQEPLQTGLNFHLIRR